VNLASVSRKPYQTRQGFICFRTSPLITKVTTATVAIATAEKGELRVASP